MATNTNQDPAKAKASTGNSPSLNPSNQDTNAFANNAGSSLTSKEEYKLAFLPNILDNYDVQTYHWKLFMTSTDAAAKGIVLDKAYQTIIAESGVSDLTIDRVELHGIACPSIESGTGTQTTVKFEIVEPSGAGLIDKIFYQSVALGIGNWLVMPLFLQLEFRGRDPATGSSTIDGSPGGLGGLRWIWPIKIGEMKANVTNVGTRYDISAVMYDELAQSNSYFSIQHNVALENLTTFDSAMKDLEKKLNDDQYEKLIDNYSIPDTYRIVVDPKLGKTSLVAPDDKKNTSRNSDYVDLSKKSATFNAGTSIDKIVDALLGSSAEYAKKLQNSDTPTSEPKTEKEEKEQMKKMWRVVTETKPVAYDALRQDNAVAITIYVVEYDLGLADVTPAQTGQTADSLEAAKRRMKEYKSKGIMKKIYNYFFTGLNDQIYTLDLNMNCSFAVSMSRFGGVYVNTNSKGISQEDNAEKEKKATEQVRQTLSFINNAKSTDNIDAKIAETKKQLADSNIDPVLQARYATLLDHAKPTERKAFSQRLVETGGLDAAGKLNSSKQTAKSLAETTNNGLTFVSDVNINSQASKDAFKTSQNLRLGKLRPVPYKESPQDRSLAMGIDSANDASRARVSSIFSTALYSSLDASLVNIKLTIKGDPFWLFPRSIENNTRVLPYKSNMKDAVAIDEIKNSHKKYPDTVNLFGTDNFIVIRFRTPRIFNETVGVDDPYTEVEMFSGVYKVVTINSKFELGRFSQELTCILDPVINLSDFLNDVENAMGKSMATTTAPVVTPAPQVVVPPTNVKKEWQHPGGIVDVAPITPGVTYPPNPTVTKKFNFNAYVQRNSG